MGDAANIICEYVASVMLLAAFPFVVGGLGALLWLRR